MSLEAAARRRSWSWEKKLIKPEMTPKNIRKLEGASNDVRVLVFGAKCVGKTGE